ncbi:T9SS type A sorting domain-containing protein [Flagellimonas pelagia]|uniref:T9SS C-terminal target domain-containing protein n=1 Tax=Flagellimonas pelagia TaxID=2306998 RepID=A0A3A1NK18_9FLAO|nr:T9SS type A sorting domain-containing protein [Allomuricauda maritima]RIV44117.1 T9SS C-terminal target domain-containing protein [Allomuricauda maritima]TXJ94026.1 T9SS type A sorting domain-containing protein [Allomuricauda maritima]
MKKLYFILIMALPILTYGQELVSINTEPIQELKGFKMYPNPAYGDEVYITTETNGSKDIQIYDVFGEVVLKDRITTNTLDISRLVPGVYVLQVTENKKTMTRKLVVK